MYYRNADYIVTEHLGRTVRAMPARAPLNWPNRLFLSMGLIVAPVAVFFLVLGIGRLVAMF